MIIYENVGLARNSRKLKNQLKTDYFVENCTRFQKNVRAIKPKLNRIEPNFVTFFPMTL